MRDLLVRGHPSEILPSDRLRVEAAARAWSRDPRLSKEDRDRIAATWLPPEEAEPEELLLVFPDGPADPEVCPACGGDWVKCGCDPDEADAAYLPEDAA
jgi:hypothetical protein